MRYLKPLFLGSFCFFALYFSAPTLYAQAVQVIRRDPANAVCWDQPDADLASANAIKVRVTFDTAPAVDVQQTCTGVLSPFRCTVPLPLAYQSVGLHTYKAEGARIDPVDGTLTSFTVLVVSSYDVVTAPAPPLPGLNPRIIKILGTIALGLIAFFALHG